MQKQTEWALEFVKQIQKLYFEDRNLNKVAQYFAPDITWIGFGKGEICHNIEEAQRFFHAEQEGFHNSFRIINQQLHTVSMDSFACYVFGTIEIKENDPYIDIAPMLVRLSVLCEKRDGCIRIRHVHLSTPSIHQLDEDYFPDLISSEGSRTLRKLLSKSNSDLQALTDNIPGGMFRCMFNDDLTLLQMSDGFLSMFGYSKEDIKVLFHNSFLEMIYEEDRASAAKNTAKQMRKGSRKTLEYRVKCKDGSLMWVMDKGQLVKNEDGTQVFYCVILDVTQEKKAQEELYMSLERHQIIMDQTTDIIFEWNITANTVEFSPNWEKKFGYPPITENATKKIPMATHLHPDDTIKFFTLVEKAKRGDTVPYAEEELRIKDSRDQYICCRVRISTQFGTDGKPAKAVGVIADITTEKKFQQRLVEKSERDALTGAYNKATVQNLIEAFLYASKADTIHAFLMIDFDNFKTINDTQGHLFGDTVLTEMTAGVKRLFRSDDLIGRIGGDEFVVFLKNIPSSDFAQRKAEQVLHLFDTAFAFGKNNFQISCSIGIAMAPAFGTDFTTLYHNADIALYSAKKQGKNRAVLFDDSQMNALEYYMQKTAPANTEIDSDKDGQNMDSGLAEYAFKVLYDTNDTEEAVNLLLKIIGKHFDVSRAYIFEDTANGLYSSNTFEWCNEGIKPAKPYLQNVAFSDLGDYFANFNEDDIFYCKDIETLSSEASTFLQPQGIKSMLQCAIRDNGKIMGFIGFDDCETHRYWTQEQINVLRLISEILSIFLFKQRTQDKLKDSMQKLGMLLDNQDSFIYVIDSASYKLLYINQKTADITACHVGDLCYHVFFDSNTPCAVCPLQHIGDNSSIEIYNPTLQVWTQASATPVQWDGKDAFLITCYDITKFKSSPDDNGA